VTLRELSQIGHALPAGAAPDWLLGCFRRRSITFYTGASDTTTEVIWLQCRGLSADFRSPPGLDGRWGHPEHRANFEGGLSRTAWDGHTMRWFDWTTFQLHDKWAEPGVLKRVGDCMIEFAPSGAYVEDWRIQPSGRGPLVGLCLLHECDVERGVETHCGGGLIVCGDHAALVRGRKNNLHGLGRLSDLARTSQNSELLSDIYGFEASYARWDGAGYTVRLSTNAAAIGQRLSVCDGFRYDPDTKLVTQLVCEAGRTLERAFAIDTLEPDFVFANATTVNAETEEWLNRESDTLLAFACNNNPAH
jgi:hypothetical protein